MQKCVAYILLISATRLVGSSRYKFVSGKLCAEVETILKK
jgi:hypothetical protein